MTWVDLFLLVLAWGLLRRIEKLEDFERRHR